MSPAPAEGADFEKLLRRLAPQVLSALVRDRSPFDEAEDAVQEALIAAAAQWPEEGLPRDPKSWLIRVASRRLTDRIRSESARKRRESSAAALEVEHHSPGPETEYMSDQDDSLLLLVLCCHPSLSQSSQVALTLRAVGGLTTAQIAHAFLVPESTMAQRISRAKKTLKAAGARFHTPSPSEWPHNLASVLHVLYLIFNEGYTATSGSELQRGELTTEALRLTRIVHQLVPQDGETAGLLALMLLTEARRPARTAPDGSLVPLEEQDRSKWNQALIDKGIALISRTLASAPLGPYQLQAAISAVHAEASTADITDWPQVLALYGLLDRWAGNPAVTLNHAVAAAMVDGPHAGLVMLKALDSDPRMSGHHRLHSVRGHLLEMAGEYAAARVEYRSAALGTSNLPERKYLLLKARQQARREDYPLSNPREEETNSKS